ncbi:MAG: hypothetical protein AAGD32_13790 [Planctomycetota bacterium]
MNTDLANQTRTFRVDPETGAVLNTQQSVPGVMRKIEWNLDDSGKASLRIPQLAIGQTSHAYAPARASVSDITPSEVVRLNRLGAHKDEKHELQLAVAYWKEDPLVFKCVKVLTQLANSNVSFSCENETTKTLVEKWFQQAMSFSFRQQWFREFFRTGMVPTVKTLIPYVPRDYRANKIPKPDEEENVSVPEMERARAVKTARLVEAEQVRKAAYDQAVARLAKAREARLVGLVSDRRMEKLEQAVATAQAAWEEGWIPGAYTIFDPLQIDIKGPREMSWLRKPYLRIGADLSKAAKDPNPDQQQVLNKLPVEMLAAIRAGETSVALPPNICHIAFGDKQPYEKYPTPIARHAFGALRMKFKLLKMDEATADQVKDRILLVKLGDSEYPMFDPSQIDAAVRLFQLRTGGADMHLFWNHAIELEWVEPSTDSLVQTEKYNHWNDEIRTAYGINRVFTGTDGKTGSQGGDILNLKGVVEEVSEAQQKFIEFLNQELRLLRTALGLSADVNVTFQQLNLRDENEFMAAIMQMVMNGLIDVQTALETLGFHFPTIEARMELTKKLRAKGLFVPSPSANNLGPDGGIIKPGGGKPTSKTGKASNNQSQKGKAKPKTKAVAKLAVTPEGRPAVVVRADELDADFVQAVASQLGTDPADVYTGAQWRELTGSEPDYGAKPPPPPMPPERAVAAMAEGTQMLGVMQRAYETFVETLTNASGNKYITAKIRQEAWKSAAEDVLDLDAAVAALPEVLGDDPEKRVADILSCRFESSLDALPLCQAHCLAKARAQLQGVEA